jgi:4-amino-4-deoxy-L-arabinose transferase-like glycosyltransferase
MTEQRSSRLPPAQSLFLAVLLLLVAFWFRTYRLADVPPGLHHDDIKNVLLVEKILDGYLRVYYPENYGHEPLYHWLQALYFAIVGSGYPEVRLLSVGVSMAGLALVYALTCRLLGREVALWTLAWQAVSLWPLFYSRRAIRGILLVPLAALTGYLYIAGLDEGRKPFGRRWVAWVLGGVSLAACLYTYAGSRSLPGVFVLFVPLLALVGRARLRARWRGIALYLLVAAVLTVPLVAYVIAHPEERLVQINAPFVALLRGHPRPLIENSVRALGMFAFLGDPHWRQYVGDTPVFEPLGAILFYAGIVVALVRWRRGGARGAYGYAFLLLWLPIALLPGMLSEGAPNFLRPIAALTVVYAFPALATDALLDRLRRRDRRLARAATAALIVLLGGNAWRTYNGYFERWPRHADARFAYNSTFLEVSRYLDGARELQAVVLSGHFPGDLDPALVDRFLRHKDLEPRWTDVRQALIYPGASVVPGPSHGLGLSTESYVIEPDYFPIDPELRELFLGDVAPVRERRLEDGTFVFAVYPLDTGPLEARLASASGNPVGWSRATVFPNGLPDDWAPLEGPVVYDGRVWLLGYEILDGETVSAGDVVTLLTYWQAVEAGPADGITFLHLLGPQGNVVSGTDGFGAPPNRWVAGDVVVQVHRMVLPGDLPAGAYPIEVGWYERNTGARWPVPLTGGESTDRLLLPALHVHQAQN